MRAVRNTENGIEVLEVPAPEGEGVRVRTRSAGICGSALPGSPTRSTWWCWCLSPYL